MNQLPAYLTQIPSSGLVARAMEGIGGTLPPHISIRSNRFKLVDASGAERMIDSLHLDVCIADISDVMCKMFYEEDWQEGSTEPPACWSANGIAPSIEAIKPQSERCDTCEWNKRGSASSLKGKPTKACRDEKYLAVLIPGYQMAFRLTLTPGSFINWRTYVEKFKGQQVDLCHVLTRLAFDPQQNGVLTFQPTAYIDEQMAKLYLTLRAEKKSDLLVGRTDRPRQGALPTPAATQAGISRSSATNEPQGFQAAPFGGADAPAATSLLTNGAPLSPNGALAPNAASSSSPTGEPPRRRRRTAAQIAADNAGAAQTPSTPAAATPQPMTAPFAQPTTAPETTAAPAFGANGGAPFGIASNPLPPPAGLDAALDDLFGKI